MNASEVMRARKRAYRAAARTKYAPVAGVKFDDGIDTPRVSEDPDSRGAYVLAWVHVTAKEAGLK